MIRCDYHSDRLEFVCLGFGIGMFGTGTRSTASAIKRLGIRSQHGFNRCNDCLNDAFTKQQIGRVDLDVYRNCEYITDINMVNWRDLIWANPEAKFVLTTRPVNEWLNSQSNKAKFMNPTDAYRYWYTTAIVGSRKFDRDLWKDHFLKTNESIREEFRIRSGNLLEVNVFEDDPYNFWHRLAEFFDRDPPEDTSQIPLIKRGIRL